MTQARLGSCIFVTGALVGRIETAKKVPTRDFSERVDAALGTDGMFSRLVGPVLRSQLPHWLQAYGAPLTAPSHPDREADADGPVPSRRSDRTVRAASSRTVALGDGLDPHVA